MTQNPQNEPAATDPYAPPVADIQDHGKGRASLAPIASSFLIGCGLMMVISVAISYVFLWSWVAQGVPTEQLYVRLFASSAYLSLAHFAGFSGLVASGYWAIRLDPERQLSTAFWAGTAYLAFEVVSSVTPYNNPTPLWSQILSLVAPIPAFLLGGVWARRKARVF